MNNKYNDWLDNYLKTGYLEIEGWVDTRLFSVLRILHQIQNDLNVSGGVMEIGVHHGRFFLPLNAMVDDPETPSFAVDIFEDQDLNIDKSGSGNSKNFLNNLSAYDVHFGSNVKLVKYDSTRLRHSDLSVYHGCPPKIISVDGGHTVEHTISDLLLSESLINDNGVVILDDILNAHWIGVFEAVVNYLQRKPTLWPFFIGYNKLFLVPMSYHCEYLKRFHLQMPTSKYVQLCGYSMLAMS